MCTWRCHPIGISFQLARHPCAVTSAWAGRPADMAAQAASTAAAADGIHTKAEHVDGHNHGPQGTASVRTPSLSWNGVLLPAVGFSVPREQGTASGREEPQPRGPCRYRPGWVPQLAVTTGRPQGQVCAHSSAVRSVFCSGRREIRAGLTGSVNSLHGMRICAFYSPAFCCEGPPCHLLASQVLLTEAAWQQKECFEVLFFLCCPRSFCG